MKLFYSPGACSLSPHIVALEAGLPIELVKANVQSKKLEDGSDFYAVNPKGYVPYLVLDDGQGIAEGPVIVQYLADQAANTSLLPTAGSMGRIRVQEWLNFITSEIHKGYSPLFNPAMPDEGKAIVRARLLQRYQFVDQALAGKDYLTGDTFTVADAYLFVCTTWSKRVNVDLSACPNILAHSKRVFARPAVQAAMKAEGLLQAA